VVVVVAKVALQAGPVPTKKIRNTVTVISHITNRP